MAVGDAGTSVLDAIRHRFSSSHAADRLHRALHQARAALHHKTHAFVVQLVDTVRPERLDKHAAFRVLRCLVNYRPAKRVPVRLKYDTYLDVAVADSGLECHRDHLRLDEDVVKVLTMKDPPAKTY